MGAPACPRSCTSRTYPRSLSQDKFYPEGRVAYTPLFKYAKEAVYGSGTLPIDFKVYKDFMSYHHGFYSPTTTQQIGGHSTAIIGWKLHEGKDYLLSLNSWGTKWGDRGTFLMDTT